MWIIREPSVGGGGGAERLLPLLPTNTPLYIITTLSFAKRQGYCTPPSLWKALLKKKESQFDWKLTLALELATPLLELKLLSLALVPLLALPLSKSFYLGYSNIANLTSDIQ